MGSNLFYYLSVPYFVLPTFLTDISDIFRVQLGRDIIKGKCFGHAFDVWYWYGLKVKATQSRLFVVV